MHRTTLASLTAACLAALSLVAASPTGAAAPVAPDIQSISYGGTGCPQGTVGQSISDTRRVATLIFDNFVASSGPGVAATESVKACQVIANIQLAPGINRFTFLDTQRGYAQLPAGDSVTSNVDAIVNNVTTPDPNPFSLAGAANQDYLRAHSFSFTLDGGASGAVVPLDLSSRIVLAQTGVTAQTTVDSFDFELSPTIGVTTDSPSFVYGSSIPTSFTPSYDGYPAGVQPVVAPTCTTSASSTSNVGQYPITCSGGDPGAGYTFQYVGGTVTITQSPTTITFAQPAGTTFGSPDVPLNATASSGAPVALSSLTPATCSVVAGAAHPLGAGTCTIAANQSGDANHAPATQVTRSFVIAKAPIKITTSSTSGVASLLTLRVTYTTTVRSAITGLPVAGVPVTTRVVGGSARTGCTATTNSHGVATCTAGPIQISLGAPYTATAAPTPNYLGGTASGRTNIF